MNEMALMLLSLIIGLVKGAAIMFVLFVFVVVSLKIWRK